MDNTFSYKDKSILYICQNGTSGYANAAKGYIYDYIGKKIPVKTQYFNCSDEVNENDRFHQYLNSNTSIDIDYNTIIVHSTPDIWTEVSKNTPNINLEGKLVIGRTVWEFEKLLPAWVDAINTSIVDIVSVPTEWNKQCFINSGVIKPVIVEPHIYVDYPHKNVGLTTLSKKSIVVSKDENLSDSNFNKYYKFYCIGQMINRKGIIETIDAFCNTFTSKDKVVLFVKTFKLNYSKEEQQKCLLEIVKITNKYDHAPIIYIKDNLNYDEIKSLHDIADCYVHLTKTEGFCLGAFDAFNNDKKVIITGYGGHTEYLGKDYDGLVDYKLNSLAIDESVFFQFKLDNTYTWAIADKKNAIDLLKSAHLSYIKQKEIIQLNKEEIVSLSTGWYDLENTPNGKFRWMSITGELIVSSNNDYDNLILKSTNLFNKKEISISIRKKNDKEFESVFSKTYEVDDSILIKIPIKDVEIIQIKSDYFSPFDTGTSEDRRKLSIGLYEFVFERQNCLYAQSIDKIKHVDEQLYTSIVENKIVDTCTNTLFNINDLTLKNIEINKPIKSGIILYLQNFEKQNKKCLDNLAEFKHSKHNIPIIIYSDSDSTPDNYPFKFIKIPKIQKMESGMNNLSNKYSFWAFMEAIKIAKEFELDYFFCYEWDCKIGKDYWYDTLWQEHLNWTGEPTMTGTPVFKCPLNGSGNLLQGIQDYRYKYSKECKLYMVVEHTYPYSLYTNGALTFYNTKHTEFYFYKELYNDIKNKSDYMDTISPWDLEIGIRLFKDLKEKSFEKVGWLPSSYSGCGDYFYNQDQRNQMLESELKAVIHQYKYT
jgi:hypothetical protein